MKSNPNLHQQLSATMAGRSLGWLIKRAQQLTCEEFHTAFQLAVQSLEKDLLRQKVLCGVLRAMKFIGPDN
jgi:hypothetical protein